ncbi:hypothetical protein [Azospirillum palustre]
MELSGSTASPRSTRCTAAATSAAISRRLCPTVIFRSVIAVLPSRFRYPPESLSTACRCR